MTDARLTRVSLTISTIAGHGAHPPAGCRETHSHVTIPVTSRRIRSRPVPVKVPAPAYVFANAEFIKPRPNDSTTDPSLVLRKRPPSVNANDAGGSMKCSAVIVDGNPDNTSGFGGGRVFAAHPRNPEKAGRPRCGGNERTAVVPEVPASRPTGAKAGRPWRIEGAGGRRPAQGRQ